MKLCKRIHFHSPSAWQYHTHKHQETPQSSMGSIP